MPRALTLVPFYLTHPYQRVGLGHRGLQLTDSFSKFYWDYILGRHPPIQFWHTLHSALAGRRWRRNDRYVAVYVGAKWLPIVWASATRLIQRVSDLTNCSGWFFFFFVHSSYRDSSNHQESAVFSQGRMVWHSLFCGDTRVARLPSEIPRVAMLPSEIPHLARLPSEIPRVARLPLRDTSCG